MDKVAMNILYGKDKYFIGAVKFFDANKDFGFIASNNCNMPAPKYNQDFYVNFSSFIEENAKKEGCVVVFQVEKQTNGKKRAFNVRPITKSDEDVNLALSYYGDHEFIEYKENKKINLYTHTFKPINLVAEKVRSIIENDNERSPKKTAQHFNFFIEHYKKENYSKDRYVFDRHFSTEEKVIWEKLLSVFTNEERLTILKIYPSIVRYFNDINLISLWVDERLADDCTLPDMEELKKTFDYIPPECAEYAKKRIEVIVDRPIKELFIELSKRSDISEKDFSHSNNNRIAFGAFYNRDKNNAIRKLWSYLHLTSILYDEEKEQCIALVKENRFKRELSTFVSEASNQYKRANFFKYLNSLPKKELKVHEKEMKETFSSLLDNYINEKSVHNAAYIINQLNILSNEDLLSYKQRAFPLITDTLSEMLHNNLNSHNGLENDFFSSYCSLTASYEEEDRATIKQMLIPILKETTSVEVLSLVSTRQYKWISIDEALLLAKQLVSSWNYNSIKEFVKHEQYLFDKDIRFTEIVIEKSNELLGNISLAQFFDGTPIDKNENKTYYSRNAERENCSFLNDIKKLIPNGKLSIQWNNYLSSRGVDDLLIMFDNGVITNLPKSIVEGIINSISLESVYAHESRWYNKPTLHNLIHRKVLKSTPVDLFPLIANRLIQLDLSEDNIPLAVLLAELMTCNKPNDDDYYALRNWEQHFESQLTSLKNSTSSNPRISVILWAVYFQSATSMTAFTDMFAYFPPYIQIRCIKKLFQLISQGKIQHTAESLYNFISKREKPICIPLEIAFAYLKRREVAPSVTLDNNIMLQLLDGREDHAEWIGIRQLVTECFGRWITNELPDDRSSRKHNSYFNGLVSKVQDGKLRLFIPNKMVDEYGNLQGYNNKYFQHVTELIRLTYTDEEYKVVNETQGISYYFDKSHEPELFAIARPFNFKFNGLGNHLDFEKKEEKENKDEYFCECRLSNKLDNYHGISFYWCGNRPCFRPPVRYMLESEWKQYTLLDFMRILNIPADYINKIGKKTMFGHYIILSSYLKSFAKFYEHLKCHGCGKLMKPSDISNFTTRAVTEFSCANEQCVEQGKIVYLNHCFNRQKCNATIDSRDSKQCSNNQYICPECGACCSTENFRLRISNLQMTGGYISDRLRNFVQNNLGHWEKHEFFCYKCGKQMTLQSNGHYTCHDCKIEYDHS